MCARQWATAVRWPALHERIRLFCYDIFPLWRWEIIYIYVYDVYECAPDALDKTRIDADNGNHNCIEISFVNVPHDA